MKHLRIWWCRVLQVESWQWHMSAQEPRAHGLRLNVCLPHLLASRCKITAPRSGCVHAALQPTLQRHFLQVLQSTGSCKQRWFVFTWQACIMYFMSSMNAPTPAVSVFHIVPSLLSLTWPCSARKQSNPYLGFPCDAVVWKHMKFDDLPRTLRPYIKTAAAANVQVCLWMPCRHRRHFTACYCGTQ